MRYWKTKPRIPYVSSWTEQSKLMIAKRVYVLKVEIFSDEGAINSEGDRSATIHCLADEKNPKSTEGRLVSKNVVNMSLLKSWLHTCENVHPSANSSPGNWAMAAPFLRVIDVQRQCIVKVPKLCRYMTLIYVWGWTSRATAYEKMPDIIGEAGWTVHRRQRAPKND